MRTLPKPLPLAVATGNLKEEGEEKEDTNDGGEEVCFWVFSCYYFWTAHCVTFRVGSNLKGYEKQTWFIDFSLVND